VVKIALSILKRNTWRFNVRRTVLSIVAFGYIVATMALSLGLGGTQVASAASLANRSLSISSSQPSNANTTYYFNFDVGTTGNIGSIELLFCTTPLGTCTAPTGLSVSSVANGDILTQTINGAAGGFTIGTNTANLIQLTRTAASATAGHDVILEFDNITNPSTSSYSPSGNNTFFTRINTYSDTAYTTDVDDGVVASAIVPLLTVSARVQEILHFCVDNTSIDDNSTNIGSDCANLAGAVAGNSVDLGVVDGTTGGATSPDSDGNGANGVFMIRANAVGGSVVGYRAVQQSGTTYQGALRVVGSTCTGVANTVGAANSSTDQCFNSDTTKTSLTANTEQFGMTGRYINRTSSATPTSNLSLSTDYDSTSTVGYAWTQAGTFTPVATTVPSTDKVVDDEAVILKFAAVSALTTPTGQYQAQADFVAVPTY
jgi:hypothetical protein